MKISKLLGILLLGTVVVLFGCGDGDAAKGGSKGKPTPTDPTQCEIELTQAQDTITQLESELVSIQSILGQVEYNYTQCTNNLAQTTGMLDLCSQTLTQREDSLTQCNTTLNLRTNEVNECISSLTECNNSLTQCDIDLGECLNTCVSQHGSLGQFGVAELNIVYEDLVYVTQMELDVICSDPDTIFGDVYDWGPNNPVNGVYDRRRAGVIEGYCCRIDTKICYKLGV